MSQEDWEIKNANLQYSFDENAEVLDLAESSNNTNHFHNKIESIIRKTLSQYYVTHKNAKTPVH